MRQNPGKFLPVVELMYLCISLGFQGRYRLSPRGPAELDRLREETLCPHRPPAAGGRARTVAALAGRRRRPIAAGARRRAGLGRCEPPRWPSSAGCSSGSPPSLNAASDDRVRATAAGAAGADAADRPRRPGRAAAAAASRRRPTRSARCSSAGGRPGARHRALHTARRRSCASAIAACSPPAAPPSSRALCRCCERIGGR